MRCRSVITAILAFSMASAVIQGTSQGVIVFNNRVTGDVNARVTFLDGSGVGEGFTAQLWGGPPGTPVDLLEPLFPTTTFRTSAPGLYGYVRRVDVVVPGTRPGQDWSFVMRVFDGASWESSNCWGESNLITTHVSGGLLPPAHLTGLEPFQVNCIPEPNALVLLSFAAGMFFAVRAVLKRR